MDTKKADDMLARLDERTGNFQKSLDFLAQENRDGIRQVIAALKEHALDDTKKFDKVGGDFEKHDNRLKILENWRWYVLGVIGLAGAAALFLRG